MIQLTANCICIKVNGNNPQCQKSEERRHPLQNKPRNQIPVYKKIVRRFGYVGYSESKYRLRISLAHPRDCHFAHVPVPSSINLKAPDAISWNLCYVYICSCALNMFKTIEGSAIVKCGL